MNGRGVAEVLVKQRTAWLVLAAVTWLLTIAAAPATSSVLAQGDTIPAGSTVRVANTDGDTLNLRAGPSSDQSAVTQLDPGASLTVTGPMQPIGGVRWIPVRTASGQAGYVSAQYVQVVSTPMPTATRTPQPEPTPRPTVVTSESTPIATPQLGLPLTVEAKLKHPEVQGNEQEITVWITRNGVAVPEALVTVQTVNGDDQEKFEELEPTNEEGRARRSFNVRREKGTVELIVRATAPDGGVGETTVSYFRR
jgi:uncharacterized protein YraI